MIRKICLIFVILVVSFFSHTSLSAQSRNTISGMVYDAADNRPVSDVYVELMNDVYSTLKRLKTDATGRFYFGSLSSGTFKVRIVPFGTNYLEETKDVEITNLRIGNTTTSENQYVDFYLRLDKRKVNIIDISNSGSVFVQNIPPEAQETYKKGIAQLAIPSEADRGFESLKKAIELFPDYYDSLLRIGVEYVNRNKYYDSLPYLVKAVTVNNRSFLGYYSLGISAFNLKQFTEAEKAFQAATIINSQSDFANLQYGMVLRILGKYKEAENALRKARDNLKSARKDELHWQFALLYEKTKRYKEAADELELFLKVEPNPPNLKQIKELIAKLRKLQVNPLLENR